MKVSAQTKPSIVFCHGTWADGPCFKKVIRAAAKAVQGLSAVA